MYAPVPKGYGVHVCALLGQKGYEGVRIVTTGIPEEVYEDQPMLTRENSDIITLSISADDFEKFGNDLAESLNAIETLMSPNRVLH
jgi:hypothetical protein